MDKLIITAAICGAEVTKEQNPNVPYTVSEIVREAKSAVDAGAAIVHLHVKMMVLLHKARHVSKNVKRLYIKCVPM